MIVDRMQGNNVVRKLKRKQISVRKPSLVTNSAFECGTIRMNGFFKLLFLQRKTKHLLIPVNCEINS